jgi:small subunit ribosomal protein S17
MKEIAKKRQFEGLVKSAKMAKTIVAVIERTKMNERYGKRYQVSKSYKVHDEKGEAGVGDKILFEECRPLSKDKRHRLIKILVKGKKVIEVKNDNPLEVETPKKDTK